MTVTHLSIESYADLVDASRLDADVLVLLLEDQIAMEGRGNLGFQCRALNITGGGSFVWPAEPLVSAMQPANGFQITAVAIWVSDIGFQGFNGTGGCFKCQTDYLFMRACRFSEIGSVAYPRLDESDNSSTAVVHSQAVNGSYKYLRFDNCAFSDIGFSSHFSHTIYPAACDLLMMRGCKLTRCPNPFALPNTRRAEINATIDLRHAWSVRHRDARFENDHVIWSKPELSGYLRGTLCGDPRTIMYHDAPQFDTSGLVKENES